MSTTLIICNVNINDLINYAESKYTFQIALPMRKAICKCCGDISYSYHVQMEFDDDDGGDTLSEDVLFYNCQLMYVNGKREVILEITVLDVNLPGRKTSDVTAYFRLTTRAGKIKAVILDDEKLLSRPLQPLIEEIKNIIIGEDLFIQSFLMGTWSPADKRIMADILPIQQAKSDVASCR